MEKINGNNNKKPEPTLKNSTPSHPLKKPNIFLEFILWSAMPPMEQRRLGLETQGQFAEHHKISEQTLSGWKNRKDFHERRMKLLRMWAGDKTPGVVQGIYMSAIKGNSDSQRIWLQYFENWSEKQTVEHVIKVQMAPADLRFIIEGMPPEYQDKFYGYITEIIDTAHALRNAGRLRDGDAPDEATEADVREEADKDASDLPGTGTNELAKGHKIGLRTDMGDDTNRAAHPSARHHQSATRGW